MKSVALILVLAGAPALAVAQPRTSAAVTLSPLHLAGEFPVVELTGEFALSNSLGLAAIGGLGIGDGPTVFELGGSVRQYLLGTFDGGMQLGGEILIANASASSGESRISSTAVSLSAFVGFKWASQMGLTFDGQLGAAYTMVNATVTGGGMSGIGVADDGVGPLLNLNVGWSF